MRKYASIALTGLIGLSFFGCSKVVTIKAQMPAEVDTLTKKRDIAVVPFKNDNVNFSGKLEAKLADVKVNNKPYFKVINRDRIGSVLKELQFQSSDLVGSKAAKFGKLAGAKVLITGSVKTTKKSGSYQKPEQRCDSYTKKGCAHYTTVYVTCQTSSATFNSTIKAIDVSNGQVVDGVNIAKTYKGDSCAGLTGSNIETPEQALNELADAAATEYVNRVAPHYVFMKVELMDKVKSIDLNDKQAKIFKNSLSYIEHGRIKKAEAMLKKLNEETGEKSYEIAYDLGVTEEALGKLKEAQAAYKLADKIITDSAAEPSELVDKAIKRIKEMIAKRKKLKGQI